MLPVTGYEFQNIIWTNNKITEAVATEHIYDTFLYFLLISPVATANKHMQETNKLYRESTHNLFETFLFFSWKKHRMAVRSRPPSVLRAFQMMKRAFFSANSYTPVYKQEIFTECKWVNGSEINRWQTQNGRIYLPLATKFTADASTAGINSGPKNQRLSPTKNSFVLTLNTQTQMGAYCQRFRFSFAEVQVKHIFLRVSDRHLLNVNKVGKRKFDGQPIDQRQNNA